METVRETNSILERFEAEQEAEREKRLKSAESFGTWIGSTIGSLIGVCFWIAIICLVIKKLKK